MFPADKADGVGIAVVRDGSRLQPENGNYGKTNLVGGKVLKIRRYGGIFSGRPFEEKFTVFNAPLRQLKTFQLPVVDGFDFTEIVQIKNETIGIEFDMADDISGQAGTFDVS